MKNNRDNNDETTQTKELLVQKEKELENKDKGSLIKGIIDAYRKEVIPFLSQNGRNLDFTKDVQKQLKSNDPEDVRTCIDLYYQNNVAQQKQSFITNNNESNNDKKRKIVKLVNESKKYSRFSVKTQIQ